MSVVGAEYNNNRLFMVPHLIRALSAYKDTRISGIGIGCENANFHSNETDFPRRKKLAVQKKRKKRESTSFSSAPNTLETYKAHSHVAIACLGCVIVNTVTCCYSHGLATGLNAVILTRTMFWLRKRKCYERFESKFSGRRGWGVGP